MSRRPGYGLEYDIEEILRRYLSGTDLGYELATDEIVKVLKEKEHIAEDAA
jgi:hypothetical protein